VLNAKADAIAMGANEPNKVMSNQSMNASEIIANLIIELMLENTIPLYSSGILFCNSGLKLMCHKGHINAMNELITTKLHSASAPNNFIIKITSDAAPMEIIDMYGI